MDFGVFVALMSDLSTATFVVATVIMICLVLMPFRLTSAVASAGFFIGMLWLFGLGFLYILLAISWLLFG